MVMSTLARSRPVRRFGRCFLLLSTKVNRTDSNEAWNGFVLEHVDVATSGWGFMRHRCREPEVRGVGSGRR